MNRSQLLPATLLALVAVSIAQFIQNQSLVAGLESVNNQPKFEDELKVWTPEGPEGGVRVVLPVTERIKILGSVFCQPSTLELVEIDDKGEAGRVLLDSVDLDMLRSAGGLIVEPTVFGRSVGVRFRTRTVRGGSVGPRGSMGRMVYQTMRSSDI